MINRIYDNGEILKDFNLSIFIVLPNTRSNVYELHWTILDKPHN